MSQTTSENELANCLAKSKGIALEEALNQVRAFSDTAVSRKINKIANTWSDQYASHSRVQISDVVESLRATARLINVK